MEQPAGQVGQGPGKSHQIGTGHSITMMRTNSVGAQRRSARRSVPRLQRRRGFERLIVPIQEADRGVGRRTRGVEHRQDRFDVALIEAS
jgi:hypothetical protein